MFTYLLIWGCTTEGRLPKGHEEKQDVIFISMDTVRADHLSCYGYQRETSPFIDSLARRGMRYEDARSSSPWTLPAHTTMFTGQLPTTHRIVDDHLQLDVQTPILPELLQKNGWRTAGVVSTLYVSEVFGFERGFDYFEDFDLHTEKKNLRGLVNAEIVIDRALEWWKQQPKGEPVFLFLHFYDAHYGYDPPEPYASMFDRPPKKGDLRYKNYFYFKKHTPSLKQFQHQIAQYDESIRYIDAQLERLNTVLAASDRSVRWVITSDHGEEFGERGSWGHAHTLYAEQLRVPLIISGDKISSKVISEGVGLHDLAPTIASWFSITDSLEPDGIDIMQEIPERSFLAETSRFKTNRISLLDGGYRLEWDLKSGKKELFAKGDRDETKDLSTEDPNRIKYMEQRIEEEVGKPWNVTQNGLLESKKATFLSNGTHRSKFNIDAGESFALLPLDAELYFKLDKKWGPYSFSSLIPEEVPLRYVGKSNLRQHVLDSDVQNLLKELGYIQEE